MKIYEGDRFNKKKQHLRGRQVNVTIFSRKEIMTGPLSIKKRSGVTRRLKIATYCQIPKISNFGDNSLDNIRDKG